MCGKRRLGGAGKESRALFLSFARAGRVLLTLSRRAAGGGLECGE